MLYVGTTPDMLKFAGLLQSISKSTSFCLDATINAHLWNNPNISYKFFVRPLHFFRCMNELNKIIISTLPTILCIVNLFPISYC